MKTIGLIGGMSWESTVPYYTILNTVIKQQLGGLHSAQCLLYSVDFDEIEVCQSSGDWEKSAQILGNIARRLQTAGADCIVICTNTMHKVAPQIQAQITIPVLHIADAVIDAIQAANITTVGLLGTKFTMEQDFIKEKITAQGIAVLIPAEDDRNFIHHVLYDELCLGIVSGASKQRFLSIIESLRAQGAGGVILGCTEIGLFIHQEDTTLPVFDTTLLHAAAAAHWALQG